MCLWRMVLPKATGSLLLGMQPVHSSMTIHSNCSLGREQKSTYVEALTVFSWGESRFNDFKIGSSARSWDENIQVAELIKGETKWAP